MNRRRRTAYTAGGRPHTEPRPATRSHDLAVVAWPAAKRTLDIVLALLGVIAFAPVMLVVAALIKLDTRGPVLFRQRRYGRDREDLHGAEVPHDA